MMSKLTASMEDYLNTKVGRIIALWSIFRGLVLTSPTLGVQVGPFTMTTRAQGPSCHAGASSRRAPPHVSYTLNSLKGIIQGNMQGSRIGVFKGDTRSLDYGTHICQI